MNHSKSSILVVDDIRRTARRYIDAFQRVDGIEVCYAATIGSAIELLGAREFSFAVIDLHMPLPKPYPAILKPYSQHFLRPASRAEKWSTNVGQLVGMYINDQLAGLPRFAYLSAVAGDYRELPLGRPALGVFDKAKIGANDFAAQMLALVNLPTQVQEGS